jgi:predicted Zn-dependent protease
MKFVRIGFFVVLIGLGSWITFEVGRQRLDPDVRTSYAPAFQLAGKSTDLLNRAMARVIPVNELDEAELGDILEDRLGGVEDSVSLRYLNDGITYLTMFTKKPFRYRVRIYPSETPNAFALPGGLIFVTQGLLQTLRSESELMAVLAHELGHIELQHCFNAVKFELLSRKMNRASLGQIVDIAIHVLLRPSFSKTQENDADEYSFGCMHRSMYDPAAVAGAFESLKTVSGEDRKSNLIDDYLATHPSLEARIRKYSSEADHWWKSHRGEKRYIGVLNLQQRQTARQLQLTSEWVDRQ